ncbi:hypothetical protein AVEN_23516-1 [Araneus ventricosus]|uniref:Uncharacterized protein n=1 Tax=Araneus ventricosus TaxID=182803 RepID=A0A4Y2QWS0_ARAVE|nr:hypothetical protein AVEN_23516-1 [Araneus ventricosus]
MKLTLTASLMIDIGSFRSVDRLRPVPGHQRAMPDLQQRHVGVLERLPYQNPRSLGIRLEVDLVTAVCLLVGSSATAA